MTRKEEVWLELEDVRLYAVDQGDGVPLLFFHGGMADHRAAVRDVGPLADRLRVITPDLRGCGRSWWSGDLSWQRHADDAVAWLDRLGLDRAVVGGVSMGSAVAVRTALSHPDRVSALVVVHPVYGGEDVGVAEAPRRAMDAMDAVGRRAPSEGIEVVFSLFDALPADIRSRVRAMYAEFDPASVAATTRFLASGAQPFASARDLAAVRCPALVVPGVDPTHPADVAALMAAHLPEVLVTEGDVAEAISTFISSAGVSGALQADS